MSPIRSQIVTFQLTSCEHNRAVGYAVPSGTLPAALKLMSDGEVIHAARAVAYSPLAMQHGIRAGWCGFELYGLEQAFALSDDAQICSADSGDVLGTIDYNSYKAVRAPAIQLSVEGLIDLIRSYECASDVEQILPFAVNHFRRHGEKQFIEASYMTFLGRPVDASPMAMNTTLSNLEERVRDYLLNLAISFEFQKVRSGFIPGPFNSAFSYDIEDVLTM